MQLARAGVPAEIISVPLAGATAPVTLAGAAVQHAAECLAGVVIHQLPRPARRWCGAARRRSSTCGTGNAPMGAIETAMLDCGLLRRWASRSACRRTAISAAAMPRVVDAQAGLETGMAALVGVLAGINMISGAGMLDFLACHSAEKLVLDAEAIADGAAPRPGHRATRRFARGGDVLRKTGLAGEFLKLKETRDLFSAEQYLPSAVIDRSSLRAWEEAGRLDSFQRARARVDELVKRYRRPDLGSRREATIRPSWSGKRAGSA